MSQTTRADLDEPAEPQQLRRSGLVLILLSLAQFMVILDITVVNVALPMIGQSLDLGRGELTWVITAYVLTFGGLLILGGRLADAFGRKVTFLAGLALFTLASLAAGLAVNGPLLISARIAQGVGAALLSPSALSIITTEFTGRDRNRALGVWAAIGGVGAAVGVMVGGALASGPGWEWAFFINVPVGLAVGLLLPGLLPTRPRVAPVRLDLLGAIIGMLSVGLLIYGLIRAGDVGWGAPSALLPIGAAIVGAAAFVLVESRTTVPLVPLGLITRGPLPGAVAIMMAATGLLYSTYFLSSIYLQDVRHFSSLRTGLIFLPVAIATMAGAHVAASTLARFGPRPVAAVGMGAAALGLLSMSWVGTTGGVLVSLLPGFALASLGIGAVFVTAITSGVATVDQEYSGVASGILNTGHELGGSLGIAVVSAVAGAGLAGVGPHVSDDFDRAFLVVAVVAALGALAALASLPRELPAAADGARFIH